MSLAQMLFDLPAGVAFPPTTKTLSRRLPDKSGPSGPHLKRRSHKNPSNSDYQEESAALQRTTILSRVLKRQS